MLFFKTTVQKEAQSFPKKTVHSSTSTLDSQVWVCFGETWGWFGRGGGGLSYGDYTPSNVQVEGLDEEIQVSEVGRLEELRLVHHGQGDPQRGPDVPRHHLVGQLVASALPLQTQGRQEVTGRLPGADR